jgi:DNA-directed RNA polymerase specialized sigma subunit
MGKNARQEKRPLDAEARERVLVCVGLAEGLARREFRLCGRVMPLEELLGEARLALADAASRFREDAGVPFRAYATMVIRHRLVQAITVWRRGGRLAFPCFSDLGLFGVGGRLLAPDPHCPWAHEPGQIVANQEMLERVRRALPPRWFTLLELYYGQGYTMVEIGRQLGMSRQRVQELLCKALSRARRHCPGEADVA